MPQRSCESLRAPIGKRQRAWSGELLATFPIQASVQRLPVSTSPPSIRLLNWQLLFRIQLISNDRVFRQTPQMRLAAGFTLLKAEARFDALKSNRCTH